MAESFIQNVNYVSELDNRYARTATISKSNISLAVGTTYNIDVSYKVYNKTTNMATIVTIPQAQVTSLTLAAYLAGLETSIETAYPSIAVTQSYTTQIDGNGFNIGTMSVVLNVSDQVTYIMDFNVTISLLDVVKYDTPALLTNTMQIIPVLAGLTAPVIAAAITVESISADIQTVASIASNVTTVALNDANVTTVATNIANVDVVALDIAHVNSVALNEINIDTVATNIGAINTVSTDIANVNTVATNIADIDSIVATVIPNMAEILLADDNATIATTKAAEALASQQATASLLDQFDDRYLGSKAIEPLVDNDGNALLVGALYFDSTTNKMRVYGSDLLWSDALILTTGSISTLTNKTIDNISNKVGADHIHYKVRNNTASIIPINTVLTASGTQPGTDYIIVEPISDPQTQIALGISHTELAVNGIGLAINTGIADNIDTSAWIVGTILYPNTTGGFTTIKPTSGRYQACAIVLRQHSMQGTLLCEFTEPNPIASTTQNGYVQLNDTLTSTSTTQALTAAQGKALQDGKQPLDATLTALAGVVSAADTIVYATAEDTFSTTTLSIFGRSLIDDIDASTARTTLGAEYTGNKGVANGYAGLDSTGKVPAAQLPSYVDDVLEYATKASLPATGVSGLIYIVVADESAGGNTSTYRWTGSTYALISDVMTATDILNLIKTVDGIGSGLDADLLDGQSGAYYLDNTNATGTLAVLNGGTGTTTSTGTGSVVLSDSAALSGTPTAPTAAIGTNTTQIASTAFVQAEIANDTFSKAEITMAIGNINSPLLDLPLKNSLAMKTGVGSVTFTRASTATYIDRYGVLKTAAIDEPRFEKEGYLNEGASTNLLTYSNQFDSGGGWVLTNSTTAQTVTDPSGISNSAWYLDENTNAGTSYIYKPAFTLTAGVTYTASFFAKKAEDVEAFCWFSNSFFTSNIQRHVKYNFDTKVLTDVNSNLLSKSVTELFNGWVRISMTFLVDITTAGSAMVIGCNTDTNTTASGIYIFGAQLEALPFVTSYIPTTSAQVTRSVDILNVTRAGNMPSVETNGELSVICDFDILGTTGGNQWVWALYNSSTNNVGLYLSPTLGIASSASSSADANAVSFNGGVLPTNTKVRTVQVINNDGNTVYRNGVYSGFDADVDNKITDTCNNIATIRIGSYTPTNTISTAVLHGHISNLRIYDKSFTAQEAALA